MLFVILAVGVIHVWLFFAIQRQPQICVQDPVVDIGVIQPGQSGSVEFVVTSTSRSEVAIRPRESPLRNGIFGTMDESVSRYAPATVRVLWKCRPDDIQSRIVNWHFLVATDDPKYPELSLTVRGTLIP